MAHVAFLWHMHQPCYVDPATQSAPMPWVRLHCTRSYLDMIALLGDYPGVRANFNLSPVLVMQIRELLSGRIRDEWLELSRKPAAELDADERFRVLENFFKANWDTLVRPFPRYWELLNKRGRTLYRDDVRRGVRYFSSQEILDLQVWFNLTWFGFTACRRHPEIVELKRKERCFTEQEKHLVLDLQRSIMATVLDEYAAASERGQVELTTSPFFHPILPLIQDSDFAARAMPGRELPPRFSWPQDAEAQLGLAVEQHAAVFGQVPRGLWPSEGSVSPELVPVARRCGFDYFCTDEEILFSSLRRDPAWRGTSVDHIELFQAWQVQAGGAEIPVLFRERPLSDFIGFTAAKNEPAQAAMHLLFHLRHISDLVHDRGIVPLMLDGENAWEFFRDGGEAFLRALYQGIESERGKLHSTTLADYLDHHPPRRRLTALHSGSWIGANFDIWIGEPEENRAWTLLGETRSWFARRLASGQLTAAQEAAARRALYAAEGSDWFWWYGPDFTTENDPLFDRLFRAHLCAVYHACGAVPPAAFDVPISDRAAAAHTQTPSRFITPEINGQRATFFEWTGAGRYSASGHTPTMARADGGQISSILFGNDDRYFYLHVDAHIDVGVEIVVVFQQPEGLEIHSGVLDTPRSSPVKLRRKDGSEAVAGLLVFEKILELAVPIDALGLQPGAAVSFQLILLEGGLEIERHPEHTAIDFTLLGEEWALSNWMV
jgi:alpha-amylase/alpha-mannosidase (GH57 family)